MHCDISHLLNKTLTEFRVDEGKIHIYFSTEDGYEYRMAHDPFCCEEVWVEDIEGDPDDLIGSPVLLAKEYNGGRKGDRGSHYEDSWTFYKIATLQGYVTIRWVGRSSGYYSTKVEFRQINPSPRSDRP